MTWDRLTEGGKPYEPMTGQELKAIRQQLGLTLSGFGRALGYQGNKNTLSVAIRRLERGYRYSRGKVIPCVISKDKAAKAIELRWSK
jgi:transcriptional regulator with XRE-family HTH domain